MCGLDRKRSQSSAISGVSFSGLPWQPLVGAQGNGAVDCDRKAVWMHQKKESNQTSMSKPLSSGETGSFKRD